MNRQRPFELFARLLPVSELRIRIADIVECGSLRIRIPRGAGKGKGLVFERQRLLIIARLGVNAAETVERMRQTPLILHRAKNFGRLFEELKCVLTITSQGRSAKTLFSFVRFIFSHAQRRRSRFDFESRGRSNMS